MTLPQNKIRFGVKQLVFGLDATDDTWLIFDRSDNECIVSRHRTRDTARDIARQMNAKLRHDIAEQVKTLGSDSLLPKYDQTT